MPSDVENFATYGNDHVQNIADQFKGVLGLDECLQECLAPKLFNVVAVTAWVLHCRGIQHQIHYLDDFLFLAPSNSDQGNLTRDTALATLDFLGIPVASYKIEGPTTTLTFLGILINTHTFELQLPLDKLHRTQQMLREWSHKRSCTRHQLESLLGYLSHAATVTPHGRTFLRSLFSILSHHMRLNLCARADLAWWNTFLQGWKGKSFFPGAMEVTSDASGSYGCGAIFGNTWFQVLCPPSWAAINITAKELVPIVIAAACWGSQ